MPFHTLLCIFCILFFRYLPLSSASSSISITDTPLLLVKGSGRLLNELNTQNAQNSTVSANGTSYAAMKNSSYSSEPNTSIHKPIMIMIACVLLIVFSCAGVVCIYIHKCLVDPDTSDTPTRRMIHSVLFFNCDTGNRYARSSHLVGSLPTVRFSNQQGDKDCLKLKDKSFSTECAVCLSAFQEDEELCQLPECCHCFHKLCIDMWLLSQLTCPLCRHGILATLKQNSDTGGSTIENSSGYNDIV
ncbi:hypothetical protein KP509_13G056800 [Ceratopteris richardii]|uniref:RING-type E3 ubiquitin transferase n=1 Tax=Ceratopteris richardii TaxID=49495 RepID=A0A8T2TDS0_CERRI|nr:hypothetical protein KP509_13G056800 [Ceratopteris richardii]